MKMVICDDISHPEEENLFVFEQNLIWCQVAVSLKFKLIGLENSKKQPLSKTLIYWLRTWPKNKARSIKSVTI